MLEEDKRRTIIEKLLDETENEITTGQIKTPRDPIEPFRVTSESKTTTTINEDLDEKFLGMRASSHRSQS